MGQEDPYKNANDPGMAKEKYALLSDNLMFEKYEAASKAAQWLLVNEPALSENMYIKALKVYDALEEKAEEGERKNELQDSLLLIYDIRLENGFYDSADYYRFKGYKLYPFLIRRSNAETLTEMYVFYRNSMIKNQTNSPRSHLTYLAALMCSAKKQGAITTDELMGNYAEIEGICDYNIQEGKPTEQRKWKKAKESIDDLVIGCLDIDRAFVIEKLCPKLEAKPDDLQLAKKVVKYSISAQCTDEPCYFKGLETIYRLEPTCGLARKMGEMYIAKGEVEKGIAAFEKATTEICDERDQKAEAYYELAELLSRKGRLSDARTYALKAAEQGKVAAYSLIGGMYMNSFSTCGEVSNEVKANPVKTQAVYLAAYEMFEKAGDTANMGRAAARFPTAEQIFTQGLKEGDKVSLDHCWIGGSYTIRKR